MNESSLPNEIEFVYVFDCVLCLRLPYIELK